MDSNKKLRVNTDIWFFGYLHTKKLTTLQIAMERILLRIYHYVMKAPISGLLNCDLSGHDRAYLGNFILHINKS